MKYQYNLGRIELGRKFKVRELILALVIFVGLMIPIIRNAIKANSLSDTTPPQLLSLVTDTHAVNTSNSGATANITGTFSDNLSGFGAAYFHYTSPSGGQVLEGTLSASGGNLSGSVTFPQYAETGTWTATVTMNDASTNSVSYTSAQLVSLGDSTITVSSSPSDTTAPTLTSMSYDWLHIPGAPFDRYIHGIATFTEDLSGYDINLTQFVLHSPNGQQSCASVFTPLPDGTYSIDSFVPDYAQQGDWTATLTMVDFAGNTRYYDTADLVNLGFQSVIHVTGPEDTTPPTILYLQFSTPNPVYGTDAFPHSSVVTIRGDFFDNVQSEYSHGVMTYTSPSGNQTSQYAEDPADPNGFQYAVYIPPYAESGLWKPTYTIYDRSGNNATYSYNDLLNMGYDLGIQVGDIQQGTAAVNGTVTTDATNSGATTTTPFVASVQTPVAGDITISPVTVPNPVGSNEFLFFNRQYDIVAPAASVQTPLQLSFTVDASELGGLPVANLQVFRNGIVAADCTDPVMAAPDPCVASRTTLPGGDAQITVRSSHASIWSLAYTQPTGPAYTFQKFKGIKSVPALNKEKGGSTVPVKFDLGGDHGLDVLPAELATSQQINCSNKTTIGTATNINIVGNGLKFHSDDDEEPGENESYYQFNWKTMKNWQKTCRVLKMNFSNGESIEAYFDFR